MPVIDLDRGLVRNRRRNPTRRCAVTAQLAWRSKPRSIPLRPALVSAVAFSCCLALCGCVQEIDTDYGQRFGPSAGASVNGTSVFAHMLGQAGHRTSSWKSLSPTLAGADVIIWIPDRFDPPSPEVRDWLADWLTGGDGRDRKLVYVGRDYDAGPHYWSKAIEMAPESQLREVRRRWAESRSSFENRRSLLPDRLDFDWFEVDTTQEPRRVDTLAGPWSDGIDAAKAEIELASRIIPPDDAVALIQSENDVLVSRQTWYGLSKGELICVTNGSFLLNLALVNHEHRKLAARLIDALGSPPKKVVFLESGVDNPPIHDEDPVPPVQSGLEIFGVWPINYVVLHLSAVGIIFCFSRLPIFGLPCELPEPSLTDFGKHVEALGQMMQRTGDVDYANRHLDQYEQLITHEANR